MPELSVEQQLEIAQNDEDWDTYYRLIGSVDVEAPPAGPKPAPAPKRGSLAGELGTVEGRLQAIAASGETPTFASVEERHQLEARRDQLAQAVPFEHLSDDAVALAERDARLRAEDLSREAASWPEKSAHRVKLTEDANAAVAEGIKARQETGNRRTLEKGRASINAQIEKQAVSAAAAEERGKWAASLKELTDAYGDQGGGLILSSPSERPELWQIEEARSKAKSASPSPEQVAQHKARLLAEAQGRHSWLTGSR